MKNKQYIIIDDSRDDALLLKKQLDTLPFLRLIQVGHTLEEAFTLLLTQEVDLLFLVIKQNGQNGLKLLENFIKLPPVIIVSEYPEYAVDSYRIGKTADYLLKPFTYSRLLTALNRALSPQLTTSSLLGTDFIFLKTGQKIQRFDCKSIDYIQQYGACSQLVCDGQAYVVDEQLSTIIESLSKLVFQQVHESYVINISRITQFDRDFFWMGTQQIPIGAAYRPQLENLLGLFDIIDKVDS